MIKKYPSLTSISPSSNPHGLLPESSNLSGSVGYLSARSNSYSNGDAISMTPVPIPVSLAFTDARAPLSTSHHNNNNNNCPVLSFEMENNDKNSSGGNKAPWSKSFSRNTLCITSEQIAARFAKRKVQPIVNNNAQQFVPPATGFFGVLAFLPPSHRHLYKLQNLLLSLQKNQPIPVAVNDSIGKYLDTLRMSILGDKAIEKVLNDKEYASLVKVMIECGFITTLITKFDCLGFEERKVAKLVFNNMLRRQGSEVSVVKHLEMNPKLLFTLMDGYRKRELAFTTGEMLRECIRHQRLAYIILNSDYLSEIFDFMKSTCFEVASDAQLSLEELILKHPRLSREYFENNYDRFFEEVDKLLTCDNYITRVAALKFVGKIVLSKNFFELMRRFSHDHTKLKRVILVMDSTSQNHQLEAFHIFKIFLATPDPPSKIRSIFVRNKEKLITLLKSINGERLGENFEEEIGFLIRQLGKMDNKGPNSSSEFGSSASNSDNE